MRLRPNEHRLMSVKRYDISSTCYDKKGNILAVGRNSYSKSSPWQKELSVKAGLSEHRIVLHSEVSALLKCKDKKVYSMQIERYNKDGTMGLAFPCPSCQIALKQRGVKIVRFTSPEGWREWLV